MATAKPRAKRSTTHDEDTQPTPHDRGCHTGEASDPSPIPSLGHRDGKFYAQFRANDLELTDHNAVHKANGEETARKAQNGGWLATGDAEIAETRKDDVGKGGYRVYAVPVVLNTAENAAELTGHRHRAELPADERP